MEEFPLKSGERILKQRTDCEDGSLVFRLTAEHGSFPCVCLSLGLTVAVWTQILSA